MSRRGRDTDAALAAVDLAWYPWTDPMVPIPLLNTVEFLRNLGRSEGPDIPFRVVGDTGLFDLAMLARVALGTRTPRSALDRIAAAMPYHCSHEVFRIVEDQGDCVISDAWPIRFDAEARHLIDQYLTAMLGVMFGLTRAGPAIRAKVSMVPHPQHGFRHLAPYEDRFVFRETAGPVEIRIALRDANAGFRAVARDRMRGIDVTNWAPLAGDGSLSHSVQVVLPGLLAHGAPGIDRIAGYAGMSRRSFQRRLVGEGARYSDLLDALRMEMLQRLSEEPDLSLGEISARLGYARQSTLSRAARRCIGQTPSEARLRSKPVSGPSAR
ncbi:helix-turn-helix transcriptional regulator [Tropicimonas sp. TH_r6]|nr:helix-turn-helix transcriptional regulator [Tropicimonas sp. TH_r6]